MGPEIKGWKSEYFLLLCCITHSEFLLALTTLSFAGLVCVCGGWGGGEGESLVPKVEMLLPREQQ